MDELDVVANEETLPIVQLWNYVSWDDMVGANINKIFIFNSFEVSA